MLGIEENAVSRGGAENAEKKSPLLHSLCVLCASA